MEKPAGAFHTIGEMAEKLGVKTHILRYWEEQFPMLRPLKRAGGRRHYRPEDVILLENIHHLLNQEGYTIKGARKFLMSGAASVAPSTTNMEQVADGQPAPATTVFVDGLRQIRNRLATALEAA